LRTNVRPFDAVVSLYPGCFHRNSRDRFLPVPILFLLGELDDDTPAELCVRYTSWMNQRGGNATAVVLPGQHHDFDAPYSLTFFAHAQNPAGCAFMQNGRERVLEKTGQTFRNMTDLFKACTTQNGVHAGVTTDRNVGLDRWIGFFKAKLGS